MGARVAVIAVSHLLRELRRAGGLLRHERGEAAGLGRPVGERDRVGVERDRDQRGQAAAGQEAGEGARGLIAQPTARDAKVREVRVAHAGERWRGILLGRRGRRRRGGGLRAARRLAERARRLGGGGLLGRGRAEERRASLLACADQRAWRLEAPLAG